MKRDTAAPISYVISASLGAGCYRHIRISGSKTLKALSDAILAAFDFDNEHAHAFFMDNHLWSDDAAYYSAGIEDAPGRSGRKRLSQLHLEPKRPFKYLFDFGDEWCFQCRVLKVLDEETGETAVVRSVGEAPDQYGAEDGDGLVDLDDLEDEYEEGLWESEALSNAPSAPPVEPVLPGVPDELYDAALTFQKTRLWKKLDASQVFALRHSDGTLGYVSVMGREGEHLGLAVFDEGEGFSAFRALNAGFGQGSAVELDEARRAQNCVMVSFEPRAHLRLVEQREADAYRKKRGLKMSGKNAYPCFSRYRPFTVPWSLSDEIDQKRLLEGMEAAMAVYDRLVCVVPEEIGFADDLSGGARIPLLERRDGGYAFGSMRLPPLSPTAYPSPDLTDDFSIAKLGKSRKSGIVWACDVVMLPKYMLYGEMDADGEPVCAPFFAFMLCVMDAKTKDVLHAEATERPGDYSWRFTQIILDGAIATGRPREILVQNRRTEALFRKLAERMGSVLTVKKRIPYLEQMESEMLDDSAEHDKEMDRSLDKIIATLRLPGTIQRLSLGMLKEIDALYGRNVMPKDLEKAIRDELNRRKK